MSEERRDVMAKEMLPPPLDENEINNLVGDLTRSMFVWRMARGMASEIDSTYGKNCNDDRMAKSARTRLRNASRSIGWIVIDATESYWRNKIADEVRGPGSSEFASATARETVAREIENRTHVIRKGRT